MTSLGGFQARYYQQEAVDSFLNALENSHGNPIIAMPTGTGKGPVAAMIATRILQRFHAARIIIAVDSKELVDSNSKALKKLWPQAPYGIYSAGLGKAQYTMPISFVSIQSVAEKSALFGVQHLLLIDEAHMLSSKDSSRYQKFIKGLRVFNPKLRVGGLTATPYRRGMGHIVDLGIFDSVCYDLTSLDNFNKLTDEGYLAQLIAKPTSFVFDVSQARVTAGEFNQSDIAGIVNVEQKTEGALQESLQVLHDRDHILVFGSGIEHITNIQQMLQSWGEDALCVHSRMPTAQRDETLRRFTTPKHSERPLRWLINDGICTKGFDSPWIDAIVDLAPTTSPGLHVQKYGRATRPYFFAKDGKSLGKDYDLNTVTGRLEAIAASAKVNARVMDFAGNLQRLGPVNDPQIPKKKGKGTGDAPIKICPRCGAYNYAAARFCANVTELPPCDFEFSFDTKLQATAATTEVVKRKAAIAQKEMAWFPVTRVEYASLTRSFNPPDMQVKYFCGVRRFTELVSIEATGWAQRAAVKWWEERLPGYPPPPSTAQGLTAIALLKEPTHIYVHVNNINSSSGKVWPRITSFSYNGETPEYKPNG